ncbi:Fic family protein [Calditrichota bacterium LG25]
MDEISHFRDLLSTFGKQGNSINVIEALKKIRSKYVFLTKYNAVIIEFLKHNPELFKEIFKSYIIISHSILFRDYFTNAGSFRNINDENEGRIYFGPIDSKRGQIKFSGASPDLIDSLINEILELLNPNIPSDDPLENAVKFYQQFVYIHPFYDGNGRIGRLIVSVYLGYFNLFIDWEKLEKEENKHKFITKLNRCHNLFNKPWYDKRIKELVNFIRKFVLKISDEK